MTTTATAITGTSGHQGRGNDTDWGARWPYPSVAGALCLEFANTLGDRVVSPPVEEDLRDYADLLTWAGRMAVWPDTRIAGLRGWAAAHPDAAAAIFTRAIALREAIYRVFTAMAAGNAPAPDDLAHLTSAYRAAMAHAVVIPTDDGFAWGWEEPANASGASDLPDAMLWPIARSAAELLVAPERARLRHCAAPDCSWLFLDATKNGSRHWCSMRGCGNRAKARRFRSRQHVHAAADAH